MRVLCAAFFVSALCVAATAARSDEVVLKNGRSLSGTVVKDDEREVVVECASGKMTFER